MKQIFLNRPISPSRLDPSSRTTITSQCGVDVDAAVIIHHFTRIPIACTFEKWYVRLGNAPGSGKSWTLTLYNGSTPTAAVITISDSETTGLWEGSVSFSAGQKAQVRIQPTDGPTATYMNWYSVWDIPSDNVSSIVFDGNHYMPNNLGLRYNAIATAHDWNTYPENETRTPIPISGTISDLYVILSAGLTAGCQYVLYIWKNNAGAPCYCVILDPAEACDDTVNSDTVVAGDYFNFRLLEQNIHRARSVKWGFVFTSNTAKKFLLMTRYPGAYATGDIRYGGLSSNLTQQVDGSITSVCQQVTDAMRLSNWRAMVLSAPGAGKSWTFTIMKNAVATDLSCTIADANTQASDDTHTVDFADGDVVCVKIEPSGNPAAPGNEAYAVAGEYLGGVVETSRAYIID